MDSYDNCYGNVISIVKMLCVTPLILRWSYFLGNYNLVIEIWYDFLVIYEYRSKELNVLWLECQYDGINLVSIGY